MDVYNPSLSERIELAAVDTGYYAHTFFPKTVRQEDAPFHPRVDSLLESHARLVNVQMFRGSAKTTKLRLYTSKRIAYGMAKTILYIGKSEGHAIRSIRWLKRQVQFNRPWSTAFGLSEGSKWQDIEAEITHAGYDEPVWIMGMGITGSIRGINQDDFRPDLIVLDDCMDEENTATPEQRKKINDLIYGAVVQSLAPRSEAPWAKLVMLQTPLNKEDASTLALDDSAWLSERIGCWTPETADLALNQQESAWPARWSSEELREQKRQYIQRNQLSVWLREMECRITSPETASFKSSWLQFYDLLPERMTVVMAIDPVPPPSEVQVQKGMRGKDYEAFAVVGLYKGQYFLLEYSYNRGHEPDWTIMEFFRLALKWRPRTVYVEAVAYQRTLAWLLRQAMTARRQYFVVEEITDKRSKYDRIVDGLSGPASNKKLFISRNHTEFISQFEAYPDVANDDVIESVAVAVAKVAEIAGYEEYADLQEEEDNIPPLQITYGAP